MRTLLLLSLFAAGLTGCGNREDPPPPVTIREVIDRPVRIPPEILSCPRPFPPPVVEWQSELVAEILDPYLEGWAACYDAVERARRWTDQPSPFLIR